MVDFRVNIRFDAKDALRGLRELRPAMNNAIERGIKRAAEVFLADARPFIPILTGALRDSGHIEQLEKISYQVVWDVANPRNRFVYAEKQHEEVLQHVDGTYAAEWVNKTFALNSGKYQFLAAQFITSELQITLGTASGGT